MEQTDLRGEGCARGGDKKRLAKEHTHIYTYSMVTDNNVVKVKGEVGRGGQREKMGDVCNGVNNKTVFNKIKFKSP